ncbi:MAG: hypothetical protein V4714_05605 [Bacteroidota bacterium]
MKKSLIVCALLTSMWACTEPKETPEYKALARANDSLATQVSSRDQQIEEFVNSVNEIENNLAAIDKNQLAISDLKKEGEVKQKDRINEIIKGIDSYVVENRQKLERLEKQLKDSKNKSAGLTKLVGQLRESIAEKEQQVNELLATISVLEGERDTLRSTVTRKEAEIAEKNTELTSKQQVIDEKETNLTTAYYKIGSRKELLAEGIILKSGGVLGAGRTFKLSPKMNGSSFTTVNTKNVSEIEMGNTDKKNVLSTHPSDSYYFVKSDGQVLLKIVDPVKFWSVSKYLVVEIDK